MEEESGSQYLKPDPDPKKQKWTWIHNQIQKFVINEFQIQTQMQKLLTLDEFQICTSLILKGI